MRERFLGLTVRFLDQSRSISAKLYEFLTKQSINDSYGERQKLFVKLMQQTEMLKANVCKERRRISSLS